MSIFLEYPNIAMNILISGGTGFIGNYLTGLLATRGHTLTLLTRKVRTSSNPSIHYVQWDAHSSNAASVLAQIMTTIDAVINLAGEGLFDKRWTPAVKHHLMESRIGTTRALVNAMKSAERKPSVLVNASAVGYYGDRQNEIVNESTPAGTGFLADICVRWEEESSVAAAFGVRVANPRIGIVLESNGGALERMAIPFKLFVGMPLGSGKQWLPWIHAADAAHGIAYPIENKDFSGAYNVTAPEPIRMNGFCAELGAALRRPSWSFLSVPEFALNVALGEAATSLTGGQQAVPQKLLDAGFQFRFPILQAALADIYP